MNDEFVFKPSHLLSLCQQYELRPSKKYGQNYLINPGIIDKIIEASDLTKNDTVIEVGPGFGVLTFALGRSAGQVITFEIEKKLQSYWEEKCKEFSNIEVVWGNVLESHKSKIISLKSEKSYKMIANLPYQITSHILRTFLELEHKPSKIVVMVQKEVAERICALKGDMSLLAVSVQYYGKPKMVAKVSKGSFWPAPKVDSAILSIDLFEKTQDKDFTEKFFEIVRAGFHNKRKQAAKNISSLLGIEESIVRAAFQEVCADEKIRAQDVSVEEWKEVVKKLCYNKL